MDVTVIGLGYIGLPTALILASTGHTVTGVDCQKEKISKLQTGKIELEEPGLQMVYRKALPHICFQESYPASSFYIVAVPTPYDKVTKKIDSTYVTEAVTSILSVAKENAVIVIESTVSPGTIRCRVKPLVQAWQAKTGNNIYVAHAPERIIPGRMIYELVHNPRTIGCDDSVIGEKVKQVYATFCQNEIILTDIATAEMSKVVENTYRDVNIAYANELAKLCRLAGLDVYEIIRIANKHPRVQILSPGPGVGGHCISVDPWFLVGDYPLETNLIYEARKINDGMPEYVLERIYDIMQENGLNHLERIGLYGLTYKENVDDVRNSPTLQLINSMQRHLASGIRVYDPLVRTNIVDYQFHDFQAFLKQIDLMVIMVGHQHLLNNLDLIKGKIIFDTRNVLGERAQYTL